MTLSLALCEISFQPAALSRWPDPGHGQAYLLGYYGSDLFNVFLHARKIRLWPTSPTNASTTVEPLILLRGGLDNFEAMVILIRRRQRYSYGSITSRP
ncbi:hypothetical protein BDV11DRAFT_200063 [Aspergillus similis]